MTDQIITDPIARLRELVDHLREAERELIAVLESEPTISRLSVQATRTARDLIAKENAERAVERHRREPEDSAAKPKQDGDEGSGAPSEDARKTTTETVEEAIDAAAIEQRRLETPEYKEMTQIYERDQALMHRICGLDKDVDSELQLLAIDHPSIGDLLKSLQRVDPTPRDPRQIALTIRLCERALALCKNGETSSQGDPDVGPKESSSTIPAKPSPAALIGSWLARRRESQRTLAGKAGISPNTLRKIMDGKPVRSSSIAAVAGVLDCRYEDLLPQ